MRILFAAPDRDLIGSYQTLLEPVFGSVVTAFDGTQILTLIEEESFDLIVLDSEIPRVPAGQILVRLTEKNIPVIMLTGGPVTVRLLTGPAPACAYLPYPFEPDELIGLIRRVAERAASGGRIAAGDVAAEGFSLNGGARLTEGEMELLEALEAGTPMQGKYTGAYVAALNEKFMGQNSQARIRYRVGEGYRLVMQDE